MLKKIYIFLFIFLLNLFSYSWAQTNYVLQAHALQWVQNDTLYVDILLKRLVPSSFALGAANFSLYLNEHALDLPKARLLPSFIGPWDASYNPADYYPMDFKIRNNFIVVNVMPITASTGNGTKVDTSFQRLARVAVPILDPSATNTLTWRVKPIAIHWWTREKITATTLFTLGTPTINLCEKPATPNLTFANGTDSLAVCEGTPVTVWLQNANAVQYKVFRNNSYAFTINNDTFFTTLPGNYYVIAENYACASGASNAVFIEHIPYLEKPLLTLQNDTLFCSNCDAQLSAIDSIKWYLDGKLFAVTKEPFLPLTHWGIYELMIKNACNYERSDPYFYSVVTEITLTEADQWQMKVFPNPFQTYFEISLLIKETSRLELQLYDVEGKQIWQRKNMQYLPGKYRFRVSLAELSTGAYTLKCISDGKNQRNFYSAKLLKVQP